MIAGSVGSGFYGRPRATNDIDIVIDPTHEQLRGFVQSLGQGYYVSPEAAEEAYRARSAFNVIDHQSGSKADLIIRRDRPFSLEEFKRRQTQNVMGVTVSIASAEDVILSKLEWCRRGQSERQFLDALGVATVQRDRLNTDYLRKWAEALGVTDLLQRLLSDAEKAGAAGEDPGDKG